MAKTNTKNVNKRPARKTRPLSTAKKPTVKSSAKPAKKAPTTKQSASRTKKPAVKPRTPKKTTPAKQRKPASKPASKGRQRNITLPLGRSTKLVVTLKRSNSKKKQPNKALARLAASRQKLAGRAKKLSTRKSQSLLSVAIVLAGLTGSVYFGLKVAASPEAPQLRPSSQIAPVVPPPPIEKSLPRSQPVRLRVPSVGIDAETAVIGLDQAGAIDVPNRYDITGWYNLGPTPGEIGPAIVVGHLDSIKGPAVFWRLYELSPGQTIEVDRADGQRATFVIETVKEYPQGALPAAEVYGNTEHAALRLITCGGTFNQFTQRYSNNTVVFARLAD